MSSIHSSFIYGQNFRYGENIIIEEDVIIGDDVILGHNVTLKSGTRIMNNVRLVDYVRTNGLCIIGNNVMVQNGACIAYGVIINDNAFIGPGVMTNHTKNIAWQRDFPEFDLITQIGYGAIVGSASSLIAGLTIGDNVYIAAGSNVYKDIKEPAIYGGNPIRKIKDLDPLFILNRPVCYKNYEFNADMIDKYLKQWIGLG